MVCTRCEYPFKPGETVCPVCGTPAPGYTPPPPPPAQPQRRAEPYVPITPKPANPLRPAGSLDGTPSYADRAVSEPHTGDFVDIEPPRAKPASHTSDGGEASGRHPRNGTTAVVFGIISAVIVAIMAFMLISQFSELYESNHNAFEMIDSEGAEVWSFIVFFAFLSFMISMLGSCLNKKTFIGYSVMTTAIVTFVITLLVYSIAEGTAENFELEEAHIILYRISNTYRELCEPYFWMSGTIFVFGIITIATNPSED